MSAAEYDAWLNAGGGQHPDHPAYTGPRQDSLLPRDAEPEDPELHIDLPARAAEPGVSGLLEQQARLAATRMPAPVPLVAPTLVPDSRSSVELQQGAKGDTRVCVKIYAVDETLDAAAEAAQRASELYDRLCAQYRSAS